MSKGPNRFTYYKCDGFEVWGKEYKDSAGRVAWRLRVFAEQDRKIETYDDMPGSIPEGTRHGESKAILEAIEAWRASAEAQRPTLGDDVELNPNERLKLTATELDESSERTRAYIQHLEQQLVSLNSTVERMKKTIQRLKSNLTR